MRKPNPEDYDPTYRTKQTPRPETVDLSDAVPIKGKHPVGKAAPLSDKAPGPANVAPNATATDRTEERTKLRPELRAEDRTKNRTEFRTDGLPVKRRTKRYSFEFYEDQLVRLKQLKIRAELAGESLSLSDMVRSALDDYLDDKMTR